MTTRVYGYKADLEDPRDHQFRAQHPGPLPPSADLRALMPPVWDQKDIGSCTAHGVGAALVCLMKKQKQPEFTPSRLFLYYNARKLDGAVHEDAGATIRNAVKAANQFGVCPETLWPYETPQFAQLPPAPAYARAEHHQCLGYARVDRSLTAIKACLAGGFPIVFGFQVTPEFEGAEVARTGTLPMPGTRRFLGGHCVLMVGYDDRSERVLVRNSWGPGWAQAGYFTMPFGYLMDPALSSDFWTLKLLEG